VSGYELYFKENTIHTMNLFEARVREQYLTHLESIKEDPYGTTKEIPEDRGNHTGRDLRELETGPLAGGTVIVTYLRIREHLLEVFVIGINPFEPLPRLEG
jgi:hypothetical protein